MHDIKKSLPTDPPWVGVHQTKNIFNDGLNSLLNSDWVFESTILLRGKVGPYFGNNT